MVVVVSREESIVSISRSEGDIVVAVDVEPLGLPKMSCPKRAVTNPVDAVATVVGFVADANAIHTREKRLPRDVIETRSDTPKVFPRKTNPQAIMKRT